MQLNTPCLLPGSLSLIPCLLPGSLSLIPCLLPGSLSLIPTFQAQSGVFFMNRESTQPPTIKTNLTDNVGFFLSFQGPHVE